MNYKGCSMVRWLNIWQARTTKRDFKSKPFICHPVRDLHLDWQTIQETNAHLTLLCRNQNEYLTCSDAAGWGQEMLLLGDRYCTCHMQPCGTARWKMRAIDLKQCMRTTETSSTLGQDQATIKTSSQAGPIEMVFSACGEAGHNIDMRTNITDTEHQKKEQ